MTTTYTIENLSTCEILHCISPSERLGDDLEEFLYVQWELTPAERFWRRNLLAGKRVRFSYHGLEFVEVWMDPTGKFWVRDVL